MSAVARGNAAENAVKDYHERQGWWPAGRRHLKGPADWFFLHRRHGLRVVEVKSTKRKFGGFGPEDRAALVALAEELHGDALLAWVPNPHAKEPRVVLLPPEQWPGT